MNILYRIYTNCKNVKFALKGFMNAQKKSKGIALFFLELRRLMGWVINATGLLAAGGDAVSIVQEAGWAQGRSGCVRKIPPHRDSNSERSRP
jgi:hypothetical protein